jgi:DNA-binding MarR family transcriptional regulator
MAQTPPAAAPSDEAVREAIELMFFAYRDFTARADALLARRQFGRAHHRVIYFVGRQPGLTVSALLGILGITKQSLARVLSQLVREGYIVQKTGPHDRRQRLLHLTAKGRALEKLLTGEQRARVASAYGAAGEASIRGFRAVMLGLMDDATRRRFRGPAS